MEPVLPEPIRESGNTLPEQPNPAGGMESAPNINPEASREGAPTLTASSPTGLTNTNPIASSSGAPLPGLPMADPAANPVIADDVDVIEKEWVDKAKKIVSATREDPHAQEKEVSKLQADYLLKRYNKQVKVSE